MQATADPWELRRQAQRCREQANALESAIQQMQSTVFGTLTQTWTGTAADSLAAILRDQIHATREAVTALRDAAAAFEQGAAEVEAYRAAHRQDKMWIG